MDIGFVVYDNLQKTSGGYRYDRKLVEYLRDQGDAVDVVSAPRRPTPRQRSGPGSLRRRLDRPFDVLLQDGLCHPSLWRRNLRLTRPTALVTLVHLLHSAGPRTGQTPADQRIETTYLRGVDAAVCTSQDTQQRVAELASLPSTVAPPAGRAEEAALTPHRVKHRAQEDPLRVAFVGTLIPRKGAVTLVKALAGLDGEWKGTLVGRLDADPAYVDQVRDAIAEHDLTDRLSVRGPVSDDELAALLERAHVLAVPSRYESFGMVYLEAMEYGVVPIASTVGGAGEFVDDGRNGLLVDPGDVDGLRTAVATLRDDRAELASLAAGALQTADAHPDWATSMAQVRGFLRSTVESAAGGAKSNRSTGRTRRSHGDGTQ